MAENWPQGTWLLLDAAGPVAVAGLVSRGRWRALETHEGDFLEWFQPAITALLASEHMGLEQLSGVLYAAGPGSTLGLRLAAMLVRSLLELPALRHWSCLQYHNLEAALSIPDGANQPDGREAVAPWRRDRLHHTWLAREDPPAFASGQLAPEQAAARNLPGYALGRRPRNEQPGIAWQAYPFERLPEILTTRPSLLHPTRQPAPYLAEDPGFARWSPRRHANP